MTTATTNKTTTIKRTANGRTYAEQVASLLHDDGTCYEADDGREFLRLVAQHDGDLTAARDGSRVVRYQFPDGSSIVDAETGWDLGYTGDEFETCTCWPEEQQHHADEHADGCAMREEEVRS